MMRRLMVSVAVIGLTAAACGGSDSGACTTVADDAIELVQELIDDIDGMSLDDLAALGDEFAASLESDFDALQTRADDASCSDTEMGDLVEERVGDLTAETQFGELFLEQFRAEGFGDG